MEKQKIIDMEKVKKMTTGKLWRWKDLAINANISEETIYALQAGRHKARDLTIYKIANALGVEPSEIVKEEQP